VSASGAHRPAWAEISRGAIAHNSAALTAVLGATQLCAVVKANGYGHGAPLAAHAALAGGATSLAVAIVDEGIELREAGVSAPILLLAEVSADAIPDALRHSLTLTVGSREGARAVVGAARARGGRHRVHVKLDTGMGRMGVSTDELDDVIDVLAAEEHLDLEGLYTHLSVADSLDEDDQAFTRRQIARFDEAVARLAARGACPRVRHVANSAGALGYPASRQSLARVGLALYGYLPAPHLGRALDDLGWSLRPAMTLRARVTAARRLDAGERPSYGRRRELTRPATVVTVPFGYADGYARRLFEAGASVLIRGRRFPLAGVVTMDQILVDVGDEAVAPGEEVVLLGAQGEESIDAEEWARRAGTITWEILCAVGARVPRVLVD
jgi:alanine racemase